MVCIGVNVCVVFVLVYAHVCAFRAGHLVSYSIPWVSFSQDLELLPLVLQKTSN